MDLEFNEEQATLRDSVREVVDGISPPAAVRAVYEGRGDASDVWRRMVELDWPGLAESGGSSGKPSLSSGSGRSSGAIQPSLSSTLIGRS